MEPLHLPRGRRGTRLGQPVDDAVVPAHQRPIHPIRDGGGSTPSRLASCTNLTGPHRGCSRRISHTTASTSSGICDGEESGRPTDRSIRQAPTPDNRISRYANSAGTPRFRPQPHSYSPPRVPKGPRDNAAQQRTNRPGPFPDSPKHAAHKQRTMKKPNTAPVSSLSWDCTVKHVAGQDRQAEDRRMRTLSTSLKAARCAARCAARQARWSASVPGCGSSAGPGTHRPRARGNRQRRRLNSADHLTGQTGSRPGIDVTSPAIRAESNFRSARALRRSSGGRSCD
ncbi:MAG: hypothetical protein JWQ95_6936 [Sphaerisporangium sp.]|nr:hypothetical protein [Sphaerisporangium sp.]